MAVFNKDLFYNILDALNLRGSARISILGNFDDLMSKLLGSSEVVSAHRVSRFENSENDLLLFKRHTGLVSLNDLI